MKYKLIGESTPNLPWQEKPADLDLPLWRYKDNPIIRRHPIKNVARIFNSSVLPYQGKFIGIFRGDTFTTVPKIFLGRSGDGINWKFDEKPIKFINEKGEAEEPYYSYDPRVIKIEDTYYVVWCTDSHGASLGLASTKDFKTFERLPNPFLPFNRNGVLFPRKINGMYKLLSRPSDSGHTPFGDIFISESPDLKYWGSHRHLMSKSGVQWWEGLKIGGGANPIETSEGWLIFYHGVTNTCNGFVYSIGGAILDIDDPSKVLYRSKNYLLTPEEDYEERGFVPNVCFPCATLQNEDGRIAVYYGAADSYVALAFTDLDTVIDYIKNNS